MKQETCLRNRNPYQSWMTFWISMESGMEYGNWGGIQYVTWNKDKMELEIGARIEPDSKPGMEKKQEGQVVKMEGILIGMVSSLVNKPGMDLLWELEVCQSGKRRPYPCLCAVALTRCPI